MKFYAKNIAIIIPTNGISNTIYRVLDSITSQSTKPGQVIIISTKYNEFKSFKNFHFIHSKKKNQVYQRNLAKKYIKKNIKLILQLDDYVMLEKNALRHLINEWNKSDKNVIGIGLFPSNYYPPQPNLIKKILDKNVLNPGRVLRSGYVTAWGKNFFTDETEWLNGGSTSWKYNKNIFIRRYPIIKWSVAEDVIFSYKKNKKLRLKLAKKSKVKYLKRQNLNNLFESCKKGFFLSKVIKNFVIYNKNLSIVNFYISTFFLSLSGIAHSLLIFNINKFSFNIGRFIGLWLKTYNYKIK